MKIKYKVFFELFGKKMAVEKSAESESEAKALIAESIKFHKVEIVDSEDAWYRDSLTHLHGVLNGIRSFRMLYGIAKQRNLDIDPEKLNAALVNAEVAEKFLGSMLSILEGIDNIANDNIPLDFQERLRALAKQSGVDLN